MNPWLIMAGVAAAAICLVHVIAGGRYVARPLLRAKELHPLVKFTNYYCWHLVTIAIAAMAGMLLRAGVVESQRELAIAATVMAGLFAIWNAALIVSTRQSFVKMPQWSMFLAVALLGWAGLR